MDPLIIVAIVFGIPAIGFAARLAVKPIADAYVRSRELKAGVGADPAAGRQEVERVARLEAEMASLRDEVGRLSAVESFYAQLRSPYTSSLPPK